MAMFLSRLKQILNLGTKSITANGTYSASGDGYDGYSQVSVNMPSVTPSNSTPAALTSGNAVTPNANGYAIASYEKIDVPSAVYTHNIYPDMPTISRVGALVGVEQMHFHSLDASNSDPDTITDGEIYRADGSGVAVASVTDVIPSSTPTSVSMDDVVHIQGSGVIVDNVPPMPTSITPSNSNPAQMTANTPVNPTTNGYAIESYSLADPAEGTRMTSGNFYKVTDNGLIIDDIETLAAGSGTDDTIEDGKNYHAVGSGIAIQGFTSITPSNSSPASMSSGDYYKPTESGYAIKSYSEVSPSYDHDVSLSIGNIYKAALSGKFVPNVININPTNASPVTLRYPYVYRNIAEYGGVAIGGYADKTPSDDDPPAVVSGAIYKVGASGYLYATKQKIKTGTVTLSTSATTYVNIGFKPKYIGLIVYKDDTHFTISVYNENISDSNTYRGTKNGSTVTCASFALPTSSSTSNTSKILSIDSTGFTIDKASSTFGTTAKYFAIGEEPTGTLPPMSVTVHHGSSSASNYAIVDNIGYTKLKLVSSTATTSAGNQYAIDNGSLVSVSAGTTVSIPSTGQVKLYLNRSGDNTAVWEFSN